MVTQNIFLDNYNWDIDVYYAVGCYYTDEIIDKLIELGCDTDAIEDARQQLSSCLLNTGLTYSNINSRHTVIVIALTNSAAEFANSIVHEIAHLAQHIGETFDIGPYSEEVCYLQGETMRAMYPVCKKLMCDCCRNEKGTP